MIDQLYTDDEIVQILEDLGYRVLSTTEQDYCSSFPPGEQFYDIPVYYVFVGDVNLTPNSDVRYMRQRYYKRIRRFFNDEIVKDLITKLIKRECSLL